MKSEQPTTEQPDHPVCHMLLFDVLRVQDGLSLAREFTQLVGMTANETQKSDRELIFAAGRFLGQRARHPMDQLIRWAFALELARWLDESKE